MIKIQLVVKTNFGVLTFPPSWMGNGQDVENQNVESLKKNIESQKFEKDQNVESLILNLNTFDVLILPMASEKIRTSKV
jgi:hypothetical protein